MVLKVGFTGFGSELLWGGGNGIGEEEELKGTPRCFAQAIGQTETPLTEMGNIVGGGSSFGEKFGTCVCDPET